MNNDGTMYRAVYRELGDEEWKIVPHSRPYQTKAPATAALNSFQKETARLKHLKFKIYEFQIQTVTNADWKEYVKP